MLLDKYLPRIEFDSYEDFKQNYRVNVPETFNFGFDIVDEWAKQEPEKKALVWCDDDGNERTFTFTEISRLSNQTANYFQHLGIRKGTVVMLILRRRWEYWVCAVALHKIGAILIPGSLQLSKKDLVYRGNSAGIHTMICVDDAYVIEQVEAAQFRAFSIGFWLPESGTAGRILKKRLPSILTYSQDRPEQLQRRQMKPPLFTLLPVQPVTRRWYSTTMLIRWDTL